MPILKSSIDTRSEEFQSNHAHMRTLVDDLREKIRVASLGGPEKARDKHVARGKLLPRERVEALLDEGSPFLELSPLAAFGLYNDDAPAAGIITEIGRASCRERVACTLVVR